MFEGAFVENGGSPRRSWSLVVSFFAQSLLVGVAILIPVLTTNTLPAQQWVGLLLEPPPPPAGPAPRAPEQPRVKQPEPERADDSAFRTPAVVPEKAALLTDTEEPLRRDDEGVKNAVGIAGSIPGGVPGGVFAVSIRQVEVKPPPPPTPLRLPEAAPRVVEVGGKVQAAKLMQKVEPVYPLIARQARISGTVRLEAIIAADGRIRELKVMSGHPLLVQSALDAVRQWRYQPTLLNNTAVEVLTHIDVNYTLR
jgi:protein TonB